MGDLALGVAATCPVIFLVVLLGGTELRDNTPIAAVLGIGGVALALASFAAFTRFVSAPLPAPRWRYWVAGAVPLLVPALSVVLWPELWRTLLR